MVLPRPTKTDAGTISSNSLGDYSKTNTTSKIDEAGTTSPGKNPPRIQKKYNPL
jgi:hypothetical protein